MNYIRRGHPEQPWLHTYAKERLYVKMVPGTEIPRGEIDNSRIYYVKCSKFGAINWDDPNVVCKDTLELIMRDNVFVVA
jgi:hypothetical protein